MFPPGSSALGVLVATVFALGPAASMPKTVLGLHCRCKVSEMGMGDMNWICSQ